MAFVKPVMLATVLVGTDTPAGGKAIVARDDALSSAQAISLKTTTGIRVRLRARSPAALTHAGRHGSRAL
jgi:hypothetical protein